MRLAELQAALAGMRERFKFNTLFLGTLAILVGLITFAGIPSLSRSIRLISLGETRSVTIDSGTREEIGGRIDELPFAVVLRARIIGDQREFWADKLYERGDQAFLTYSDRLGYGVVTGKPPKSFVDFLGVDLGSNLSALGIVIMVSLLTFTNIGLILLAALEHVVGPQTIINMREARGRLGLALSIGTSGLEALLGATLSLLPVAACLAAFSVSLKIEDDTPWTMYIIYGSLLVFFVSHITAGVAVGLLKLFRSQFGRSLKEIVAYVVALLAALQVVIKIINLTFSDRVVNLSSWWAVAQEFFRTFF